MLSSLLYWHYGGANIFGSYALAKLLAMAAVGGLVSFALYAEKGKRTRAAFPGLLVGIGAAGAFVLYVQLFNRTSVSKGEIVLIQFVGAIAGFLLLQLVSKGDKAKTTMMQSVETT